MKPLLLLLGFIASITTTHQIPQTDNQRTHGSTDLFSSESALIEKDIQKDIDIDALFCQEKEPQERSDEYNTLQQKFTEYKYNNRLLIIGGFASALMILGTCTAMKDQQMKYLEKQLELHKAGGEKKDQEISRLKKMLEDLKAETKREEIRKAEEQVAIIKAQEKKLQEEELEMKEKEADEFLLQKKEEIKEGFAYKTMSKNFKTLGIRNMELENPELRATFIQKAKAKSKELKKVTKNLDTLRKEHKGKGWKTFNEKDENGRPSQDTYYSIKNKKELSQDLINEFDTFITTGDCLSQCLKAIEKKVLDIDQLVKSMRKEKEKVSAMINDIDDKLVARLADHKRAARWSWIR
ncbi:MAG: hypothetical protein AAF335_04275 [Bacteroidota bacterium]